MKESSTSSITDWKSRYFHLVEDGLIYYESTHNVSQVSIHLYCPNETPTAPIMI